MHFRHKFILYLPCINLFNTIKTKEELQKDFFLKSVLIPKLLNNPLASCCLINVDFVQSNTAHFDKSIILPVFVLATFGFYFKYFFCTSNNNTIALFYK